MDILNSVEEEPQVTKDIIPFVTEVANYFMDFLETDFHKVRSPKRKLQNRNSNNLQIGVNLNKYKKYNSLIWRAIRSGFEDDAIKELKRGIHTNHIPQSLLKLIQDRIAMIDIQDTLSVIELFQNEIQLGIFKNPNDTTSAITFALDGIERVIRQRFLDSFIEKIREPLDKIKISTIDSVYHIEEELTELLMRPFDEVVSFIINQINLGSDIIEANQRLAQVFELKDVQNKLECFFKGFAAGDLFFEVLELVNNKNLLEKQEFYLYFCDIRYKKHTYPLFYIPLQIEKTIDGFSLTFDSLLYVNKKVVQFVSQDYNAQVERKGSLGAFIERIIYLSEDKKRQHLIGDIDFALKQAINYFGLNPYIDIHNTEYQAAKGQELQITNSCYFALFDKSDESLVNDYEEILQKLKIEDDGLADSFQLLIDDFITNNPISVVSEVEYERENQRSSDKLVYTSPVSLNEEQQQILAALNKKHCKYIMVEGPPGTGKSHTITAIVCNAILKNQSILVLSDKKEALDVVEHKITETMNKVRLDKQFQNPILRLGQAGNSYAKILSTTSMECIKEHYKAVRNDYQELKNSIKISATSLKNEIENTIIAYNKIKPSNINEFNDLEEILSKSVDLPVDLEELYINKLSGDNLVSLRSEMSKLKSKILNSGSKLDNLFKNYYPSDQSMKAFRHFMTFLSIIEELQVKVVGDLQKYISQIRDISIESLDALEEYIAECVQLKSSWFGYLFKGQKIINLNQVLSTKLPHDFKQPHHQLSALQSIISLFKYGQQLKELQEISNIFEFNTDFIKGVHQLLNLNILLPTMEERNVILNSITFIETLLEQYPQSIKKIDFDQSKFLSFVDNNLTQYPEINFKQLIQYLNLRNNLHEHFLKIPEHNYIEEKKVIEELVTTQMTYKMDKRVVDFFENHRNDAKTLSGIISKKQRFDKSSFNKLKNAFPCILAGIRDFAEYIPLESEIFDIVIIDEASQVSIAQAFPALLRGKKIIVLGDNKQFNNVKSTQARSDINCYYLNRLREVFIDKISDQSVHLERLEKFNVKTSILSFFERISNYSIMLKKHFRSYRENISYSSKYFYSDSLQVIKIRAKPIDDVIKFTYIEHDGRIELVDNSNQLEVEAIVTEVERIAREEPQYSIGIITPHTNQQKLLMDALLKHSESESFQKQHKLRIMTFDTCQGEERDIILYSMVANPISDKLWGIFIKDRNSINIEESGQIKLQRLNVGFSRAKERIHFFLSKPISDFTGSISEALQHYQKTLEDARRLPDADSTDARSPMEKKVLHWIQETDFFKSNRSTIELHAQFPLGDYIKQLDKRYSHNKYVVDFLLTYTDEYKKLYNIIIEYDGFKFHFKDHDSINKSNYDQYRTDQDIYREKVLESYGYNFLRINRFNIDKEPVKKINQLLSAVVKKKINKSTY